MSKKNKETPPLEPEMAEQTPGTETVPEEAPAPAPLTEELDALKKQLEMQMGTLVRLEELMTDHPTSVRRIMAEMEFTQCEVFYRWRPELREAGQTTRTREETDERCRRYVDVIRAGKR